MKNPEINKIIADKQGNLTGVLAVNKQKGVTSHDIVNSARRLLRTRKVGHAGALDPFATGVLILLIGKATKLSDSFLNLKKEYSFELLLGITTDTQDPEGQLISYQDLSGLRKDQLEKAISDFPKTYNQTVPVYSSVKVNGIRLRKLARAAESTRVFKRNNSNWVQFSFQKNSRLPFKKKLKLDSKNRLQLILPRRVVQLANLKLLKATHISSRHKRLQSYDLRLKKPILFIILTISVTASKGTYIRQLAEDIGSHIGHIPASLLSLNRTKVGDILLENCIEIDKVENYITGE